MQANIVRIVFLLFCFLFVFVDDFVTAKDLNDERLTSSSTTLLIAERGADGNAKPVLPAVDRFEGDIRAFEEKDLKQPAKAGATVFVGSSTFRFWTKLEDEFKEFNALNRGFGGSTFPDINHYVARIVNKYKPAKIVVYAGTNDIAELNHTGQDILNDFQEFVRKVQTNLPRTEIYFVSMSVAPSRLKWLKQYEKGNELIRGYINSSKHLHYIDVLPVMRKADGQLRNELFGPDSLHMNKDGYALWTPIIRKALESNDQPG